MSAFDYDLYLKKLVKIYKENMNFLYKNLPKIGINPVIKPEGSFYLYADITNISNNSVKFCKDLLIKNGIALTPGIDFDSYEGKKYIRFSYSRPKKEIIKGFNRLKLILLRKNT